ncbi:glycoside hydrolase [Paenibacillus sp. FSL R7-0273]|uniref:glycoside hydrolase family 43 protein n=1 Tax=Paenibacillus sp. FSL R7-0273 TaxID=1536772 RepID=UPI0004F8C419|nr:glycoside hydrolase 43 family protein [Paenibacillus sp. FSL R7-0273]AIQ47404.1 glycoside hydrolase [Paenibacillus sp. FSL R7-0273]OMF96042.1 glycoside hydrolase [Paenibacillus sp. FSL R7-0273]
MNTAIITNPVMWADVPDVDVIRVGPVFYMVSTSMHSMPGCPIMKSVNLRDWEIVNYVYDTFEDNEAHRLQDGKGIYGRGSWAASLKYKDGIFYVCFSSNDMNQLYVYRTEDIEHGIWERSVIPGLYHDPALLLDDDGRNYVLYGNGDIRIRELTEDLAAVKPGGADQLLLEGERTGMGLRIEGCHAYKLNGYYYLFFIEWPQTGNKRRRQVCYRSRELFGPYELKIILDDDLGYHNKGVVQGGIVDTPDNGWYAVLFQDHDAVGRIPCVLPVSWDKDWPVIGVNGKVPRQFETGLPAAESKPLVISDEFDYETDKLALNWQWNHNPDNSLWSVTERPSFLRLRTGQPADSILTARNTLTQRTEGPACSADTVVELSGMQPGDRAGMTALQNEFGVIRITAAEQGQYTIDMCVNGGDGLEKQLESVELTGKHVYLKIEFNFEDSIDEAAFFYSKDGIAWTQIGRTLHMKYTLDHFMGYRIGLFNYATRQSGGYADFGYFHYRRSVVC